MQKEGVKRAVLVINGKFSLIAKQSLADVSQDFTVEHFLENELLVDITEHELVPEHVVLTDDEKAALLARYKLKEAQLPRIQLGDAVARFYGMTRGQVVKVRESFLHLNSSFRLPHIITRLSLPPSFPFPSLFFIRSYAPVRQPEDMLHTVM